LQQESGLPGEDGAAGAPSSEEVEQKLQLPISALNLSVRAYNCLDAENIRTVSDLVSRSEEEMLKVRNFGKNSLNEVKKKLDEMGLHLGMTAATSGNGLESRVLESGGKD
jgi:DNA-directed RNA polymerase subunit alpha